MSDASFTSADMLLRNLVDHQVIRIEGSNPWMKRVVSSIVSSQDHCLVLEGTLSLAAVQAQLAGHLGVESGASFIQQALKQQLESDIRLHIIVDSNDIEENALVYLLGLPSICNEQGSAATIILVSTDELVQVLKSSSLLAAKLDGYYQEEKERTVTSKSSYSRLGFGVALACLSTGVWLYLQDTPSVVVDEPAVVSNSKEIPQKVAEPLEAPAPIVPTDKPLADDSMMAQPVTAAVDPANESIAPDSEKQAKPAKTEEVAPKLTQGTVNETLLADLTATVAKAKAKATLGAEVTSGSVKQPLIIASVEAKVSKSSNSVDDSEDKPRYQPTSPLSSVKKKTTDKPVDFTATASATTEVRRVIGSWSAAWQQQDWDAYISSYLQNTKPYGVKVSLEEWREFRKQRLLSPEWIKLEIGDVKLTRLDSHWYRAEFYQRFEKPGYADETTKRLELTLTSNGWRIASEATDGTVVLKRPQ